MNKHIKLVEKWLNDKDSVTQEELEQNKKDAAYAADTAATYADAYAAIAAYTATAAADADAYAAAAYTANYAADVYAAAYWIDKYYKLTGETK